MTPTEYKTLFYECFDSPYSVEAIEALGVQPRQIYRRFDGSQEVTKEAALLLLHIRARGPLATL